MKKINIHTKAVVCIVILILLPSVSVASARYMTPENKELTFHPQFWLDITSPTNDTVEPILPNETRTVQLEIDLFVIRGIFGGLLLRLLEGRSSPITLIIVDKSDWCTVTVSPYSFTGVVSRSWHQYTTNLTITLSEDAPPLTMGFVKIGGFINDIKGPFNLHSFIWGSDAVTTVNFFTGPE